MHFSPQEWVTSHVFLINYKRVPNQIKSDCFSVMHNWVKFTISSVMWCKRKITRFGSFSSSKGAKSIISLQCLFQNIDVTYSDNGDEDDDDGTSAGYSCKPPKVIHRPDAKWLLWKSLSDGLSRFSQCNRLLNLSFRRTLCTSQSLNVHFPCLIHV